MNTKSKATVATIGLGALVLSGGTLALWQDQASLTDATINTGHLSLQTGEARYYDASELKLAENAEHPDGLGHEPKSMQRLKDHEIENLAEFDAVPGDTILVVQPVTVDLKGHNLLADLELIDEQGVPLKGDFVYAGGTGDEKEAFITTDLKLYSEWDVAGSQVEIEQANVVDGHYHFTEADGVNGVREMVAAYQIVFQHEDGPIGSIGGDPNPEPDAPEMNRTVKLDNIGIQLTQVRETH